MIWFDENALAVGALLGVCIGSVYFIGLAFGVHIALHMSRPTMALLLSALVRIALLCSVGVIVLQTSQTAFAGYCLAFLLLRLLVVGTARYRLTSRTRGECNQWN